MTLCNNCKHAWDLHDASGICSFPDCKCTDGRPMSGVKEVDKNAGSWFSRHFGKNKGAREQLESH